MKKIRIISLVAAICVFVLAAMMYGKIVNSAAQEAEAEKTKVVVALTDIAPCTEITSEMVEVRAFADTAALGGYFSLQEDVVGKVAVTDIYAGEVFTDKRIVDKESEVLGLSAHVEPGMRAVTLSVDAQKGVGFNLKVGYRVDVLMTKAVEGEEGIPAGLWMSSMIGARDPENTVVFHENLGNYMATLAIQNLKVLAIDDTYFYTGNTRMEYSTVTLEVTPRQAEQIALINGNDGAAALLTLRGQDDEEIVSEPRESLLNNY